MYDICISTLCILHSRKKDRQTDTDTLFCSGSTHGESPTKKSVSTELLV